MMPGLHGVNHIPYLPTTPPQVVWGFLSSFSIFQAENRSSLPLENYCVQVGSFA